MNIARRSFVAAVASAALPFGARGQPLLRDYYGEAIRVRRLGQGPDVIMTPGKGSSGDVWQDLAAHLAQRYCVHMVYLRGFAGEPANPSLDAVLSPVVDDIERYVMARGLKRPVLIGHSMGGTIALALAAKRPALPSGLLLVESGAWMPKLINPKAEFPQVRIAAAADRAALLAQSPEAFLAAQRVVVQGWARDADKQALLLRWLELCDRRTLANAGYDLYTTDLRPRLHRVTAPMQLVTGWFPQMGPTQDGLIAAYQDQFANLRKKQIVLVPDSRHFVMFDQPERVRQEVDKFLGWLALSTPRS